MKDLLNLAIDLANRKMADTYDRSGYPAILHPLRVMMKSADTDGRIVGVMHDLIEDTDTTLDELRLLGFPEHIVNAMEALSRHVVDGKKETYAAFIERIASSGKLAIRVKLNDLDDNLSRIKELPEGEGMTKRYRKAKARLMRAWEYES